MKLQDRTGQDRAGQDKTRQSSIGQDRHDRAEQTRIGQLALVPEHACVAPGAPQ